MRDLEDVYGLECLVTKPTIITDMVYTSSENAIDTSGVLQGVRHVNYGLQGDAIHVCAIVVVLPVIP